MKRNRYIKVRVSEEELQLIKSKAAATDSNVSDLLRHLTLNMRIHKSQYDKELIRQIARIGSNINQLARWANRHKERSPTLETVLWLNRIYESVKKLKSYKE